VDVGPIVAALAQHPCTVAHAPRQHLAILAARFGVAMPAIVDTQAMAAFAGMGDQIGFAALANELLGLSLGKELQWTNWAARQRADQIAAVLDAINPDAVAPIAAGRPLSPRAQRWTDVLLAIVQLVADQSGIPPRLLATRSDAEELARTVDERGLDAIAALPAMSTWRREVLGAVWARWLAGELALVGDLAAPHGIRLVAR